jgi:hypothetical protein
MDNEQLSYKMSIKIVQQPRHYCQSKPIARQPLQGTYTGIDTVSCRGSTCGSAGHETALCTPGWRHIVHVCVTQVAKMIACLIQHATTHAAAQQANQPAT